MKRSYHPRIDTMQAQVVVALNGIPSPGDTLQTNFRNGVPQLRPSIHDVRLQVICIPIMHAMTQNRSRQRSPIALVEEPVV
jgi:hypothetical protein